MVELTEDMLDTRLQMLKIVNRMDSLLNKKSIDKSDFKCILQSERDQYLQDLIACFNSFGVSVINESGVYREPKAVVFDLVMQVNHLFDRR